MQQHSVLVATPSCLSFPGTLLHEAQIQPFASTPPPSPLLPLQSPRIPEGKHLHGLLNLCVLEAMRQKSLICFCHIVNRHSSSSAARLGTSNVQTLHMQSTWPQIFSLALQNMALRNMYALGAFCERAEKQAAVLHIRTLHMLFDAINVNRLL